MKHFEELIDAFRRKAEEFKHIIKMGRTQLEDAVPMTLGQTFNGFASILHDEIKNLNFAAEEFLTVNMGLPPSAPVLRQSRNMLKNA